jgi:PKD repeat protein
VTLTADATLVDDPPPPLWDLGNTEHRSGNPLVYVYPNHGNYTVVLTASDKNCHTTQLVARSVTVRPTPECDFSDLPPQLQVCCGNTVCDAGEDRAICPEDCGLTVSAGGPYEGSAGQPISFHAAVDTSDPITSHLWTFGDGSSSSEASPAHVYAQGGSYTVGVVVTTTRASGTATSSALIHPCHDNGSCEESEGAQCADCAGQPACGNGAVDPGETCTTCPRDVAWQPTFSASPWAPFVDEPVVFSAVADLIDDPGHPLWDLGNGTHVSGNPYSYTYGAPGSYTVILTASEKRCHTEKLVRQTVTVRPRPGWCDFSDIPPPMQVCCGNEYCDGGETPNDCPSDCGNILEVSAGGPYQAAIGEPVHFHGTVTTPATVTSYLWNFGDGGFSSEHEPSHAYAVGGTYTAQLFVTTSAGSGSATAEVTIGSTTRPEDDALILHDTFPPVMVAGRTYPVTVTVQNTGESRWVSDHDAGLPGTNARGFALAAKSGRLLTIGTRFTLPPHEQVQPEEIYNFQFDVVAPQDLSFAATELQMVNGKFGWFGETRYFPVNLGHFADGVIELDPSSGPPGTVVTVHLVSGPPFPLTPRGRFNFGDPKGSSYSRVAAPTTGVSEVEATFVVPDDAGCGEHYYTILDKRDPHETPQPDYAPAIFTVTSPCDPTRRNSLDLLNYNIQFLPNPGCTLGWFWGGAPVHTCKVELLPIFCDDCHKDERLPLLANHPDLQPHDVIVFEEAWTNSHRDALLNALRPQYPYQSSPLGGSSGAIHQNGGVVILSKWPIEAEDERIYAAHSGIADDLARKGVLYARINKAGLRYHVFGTHTDADKSPEDVEARTSQMHALNAFVRPTTFLATDEPVLIAGDFNIDKNLVPPQEYDNMRTILDVTHPPTTYRDGSVCPSPLPPPPPSAACQDDFDCEKGQQWYMAECAEVNRFEDHRCRYTPICWDGIGTNLDGNWIDYVLYPSYGHVQPVSAQNLVITPRHLDSPYPGTHLSDHFAVLGTFRYGLPENLGQSFVAPPGQAPVAQAPAERVSDPTPTFSWNPTEATSSYTLSVERADDQATLLRETNIGGTSFTPDTLLPSDVNLRWDVRGVNPAGSGPSSTPLAFRIERDGAGPPTAAPVPAWPVGATPDTRPQFLWTAVPGVTSYVLRVATSGQAVVLEQPAIFGTAFVPLSDLPAGLDLTWSVRAESEFGPGPWSPPAQFRIEVPPTNQSPTATVSHTGSCTPTDCTVTFAASVSDPDGDPLSISWSGCATGAGETVPCTRASEGPLDAAAAVADGRGGTVTATDRATVTVGGYSVGWWSVCLGTGAFACTGAGPGGCARPGSQTRTVSVSSWVLDGGSSPSEPPAVQSCTETTTGYIATYNATYAAAWTCTGGGPTGCYKDLVTSSPASFRSIAPDAPAPASRIYTPGYVASWSTGSWSGCSASCGGGVRRRSVWVASWKAVAPDAARPADEEACNTQPCRLTCYDWGLYPTWPECYGAGWTYCDTRYRDDGVGGLLTCRHGYE